MTPNRRLATAFSFSGLLVDGSKRLQSGKDSWQLRFRRSLRVQRQCDRILEAGAPSFLPRGVGGVLAKRRARLSEVAVEQRSPEAQARKIDGHRVEFRRRCRREPQRARRLSAAGGGHRDALNLGADLGPVIDLDRELERATVPRQRVDAVAADERAVGQKMVRKMFRANVARG
jgi:hypothetical protein